MPFRFDGQPPGAPRLPRRAMLAPLAGLALLLLAACGTADPRPAPTAPPTLTAVPSATIAPAAATATADPQVLLKDGGIGLIQIAYDRLLDEYIVPVEPAPLLIAAWDAMAMDALGEGLAVPIRPAIQGGRDEALIAFAGAYVPFANSVDDATQLRYAAIRGMAATLNDCHTFFLNPVASDTLVDNRSGKGSVGIGVELAGVPPLITEVITDGPAARAGVLIGDRIAAIDGDDVSALGPSAAFDLINGDEGTQVRLSLRRPGVTPPVDVTIARERVTPPNLESRIVDGVGYVRLRHFVDAGVKDELQAALKAFEAQDIGAWIIDLRGNPGGRLDSPAISLFIKDGVIVRDRGRDGVLEEERATGDLLPSLRPTVLLTNNRTGSVAEIFAAALKEYGVAEIIGTNSNGCVGYTDVRELGDGSSLAVTTHEHLGPITGTALNGAGVQPDLIIGRSEADIANLRDPQLDAAISHLKAKTGSAPP